MGEGGENFLVGCNWTIVLCVVLCCLSFFQIKCARCHGKSERQERMMDLTVEIEGDIETLEDALRKFTGTECLDGDNKYYCSRFVCPFSACILL